MSGEPDDKTAAVIGWFWLVCCLVSLECCPIGHQDEKGDEENRGRQGEVNVKRGA